MPGVFDTEYVFAGGANNGQISASIDHISGQQVNYAYDSLKRLSTAGTAAAGWGQAYTYDGFGNLTTATVTQGSGVNFAQAYDPSTNHAVGNGQFQYDANGNQMFYSSVAYDAENRMTLGNGNSYTYDPSGKRVWMNLTGSASGSLYFYDIFGKMVETVTVDGTYGVTQAKGNVYFGNRLVVSAGETVVTDRPGSVRYSGGQALSYLPYGIEQTSTPNGQVKFGTYLRDGNSSTLGADYADQRYYNPWFGRFNTPDPSKGVNLADSGSWNKYAYVHGDPVNFNDPEGMVAYCPACGIFQDASKWGVDVEWNFPSGGYDPSWLLGVMTTAGNQISQHLLITLPIPKEIIGGTSEQQNALTQGFREALDRLNNPNCGGLFNPTGGFPDPAETLKNTSFRILPFGNDRNAEGAATIDSSTVFVNGTGPFFDQNQLDPTTGTFKYLDFGTGLTGPPGMRSCCFTNWAIRMGCSLPITESQGPLLLARTCKIRKTCSITASHLWEEGSTNEDRAIHVDPMGGVSPAHPC